MKKGFALLETIIVITFVSVSLILLYNNFTNMTLNNQRNILYDDVANIYKVHYVLEYLNLNDLSKHLNNEDITFLDCNDFSFSSCNKLFKTLNINKLYLTKYNLNNSNLSSSSNELKEYVKNTSNKGNYKYRLILEFSDNSFASLGFDGDNYE